MHNIGRHDRTIFVAQIHDAILELLMPPQPTCIPHEKSGNKKTLF
jgi:hypothetical protein